ncbi:MAG: tyrosine-type recombinase/integrase [Deltaproteobacteria bacterium]|nr:tyrosine-type recombinase/integrase [Deltaproteobacteria bacterium]
MEKLIYGSGLRLMECIRLRVHDINFGMNEITVRDSKGFRDRITMLPEPVKPALSEQLSHVKIIHENDLHLWGRLDF